MITDNLFSQVGDCIDASATCLAFADVVSKIQLGNFPPGTAFASAWFFWKLSELRLYEYVQDNKAVVTITIEIVII